MNIDFLISDPDDYRELRQLLSGAKGLAPVIRQGAMPLQLARDVRIDQYGIRTQVLMDGHAIKFEFVCEARIALQTPSQNNQVCGVLALTALDLAMMDLLLPQLRAAVDKATQAYGSAINRDLAKAIDRAEQRAGWLERCMQAMAMQLPKAVLWQKIRRLKRLESEA